MGSGSAANFTENADKSGAHRPKTTFYRLYGVFASSSDSDSDSKKRKRMKLGQSKNNDLSKPVNFVSSMPSQKLNLQDPQKDNKHIPDKNALDIFLATTALGKKIQEGVNKQEKEKEKLMKIQNLSQAKKKESDCNGVVGEFEKHTKGIRLKLLEKMGYKGGGLGKNQQGIMAPIETKLRPKNMGMGFNDYKKAFRPEPDEKPAPLSNHEVRSVEKSWLKHNAVKKKNPITVEELLTLKQERDFEYVQKIVDRRGPQVRVLTNLKDLNTEEKARENDAPMSEFQKHIKLKVDLAELEIQERDRKRRNEKEKVVALEKEKEKLHNYASRQNQQLEKMEEIVSLPDWINELNSSGSLTLESLAKKFDDLQTRFTDEYTMCNLLWFEDLQTTFADEDTMRNLSCIACSYGLPLFVRNSQGRDPLENPTHGVEVVSRWKRLLQQGQKDLSGSGSPYMQLLAVVVLPAVRTCGTNSWSVREPESMIRFLETWEKLLPPAMMQAILDTVIMPKISAAVNSWDPCQDTIPIHLWVHPWMPWLGQKLGNCYQMICDRLSSVLHAWHPRDKKHKQIVFQ